MGVIRPSPSRWRWLDRLLGARSRPGGPTGLALGGGGARGLAHIGVLKVLEEHGVQVDVASGASMGGVIAIAWAAGIPAVEMEALARRTNVFRLLARDRTGLAIVGTERIAAFVSKVVGYKDLAALPRRCAVMATDITNGRRVVIDKGSIERAVQATIAIPGLFSPVLDDGRLLIDGGIIDPVPVEAAVALGARRVIAVDVSPDRDRPLAREPSLGLVPRPIASSLLLLRLLRRQGTLDLVIKATELQAAELMDMRLAQSPPAVLLRPAVGRTQTDGFHLVAEAIAAGEAAARAALPALLGK